MHLLLAYGSTSGDNLLYHDGKIPSAEKVDLRSTSEVAAGLDSKLFIQVLTFELHISIRDFQKFLTQVLILITLILF